jgi:hypothetical protein
MGVSERIPASCGGAEITWQSALIPSLDGRYAVIGCFLAAGDVVMRAIEKLGLSKSFPEGPGAA